MQLGEEIANLVHLGRPDARSGATLALAELELTPRALRAVSGRHEGHRAWR